MFKNKTIFLILFLIILLIIIILVQFKKTNTNIQDNNQNATSVTRTDFSNSQKKQNSNITSQYAKLFSVIPDNDQVLDVTSPVVILFDKPINPELIQIYVTPDEPIDTSLDISGTTLQISPVNIWKYNTVYTINIDNLAGKKALDQNYKIEFKTVQYKGI